MVAAISSIHESSKHGQALLDEVVQLFADLLVAGGATATMIEVSVRNSLEGISADYAPTRFTVLGSLLRDCMEVMCAWRREIDFTDAEGAPKALQMSAANECFEKLCTRSKCRQPATEILRVLVEFGAVSIGRDGEIRSETPTFILGRASKGGRLATDALLKHLEGFLRCVHRNVRSVSGEGRPRFERACTVTVASELEPVFDQLVRRRGQEFIDCIDEWLERHSRFDSPSNQYVELGVGAYFVDFGEQRATNRALRQSTD